MQAYDKPAYAAFFVRIEKRAKFVIDSYRFDFS
eukprot:SAG31_NODE_47042_length_252_cov_0.529412_1_plen_32_part_01